jgi:hypothetical protein
LRPLFQRVEDLRRIAVAHDRDEEEGVRVGEGENEGKGEEGKEELGVPWRYRAFGNGAASEDLPLAGHPGINIPGVVSPVHVVVEDHPRLEAEERDEGSDQYILPRIPSVGTEGEKHPLSRRAGARQRRSANAGDRRTQAGFLPFTRGEIAAMMMNITYYLPARGMAPWSSVGNAQVAGGAAAGPIYPEATNRLRVNPVPGDA